MAIDKFIQEHRLNIRAEEEKKLETWEAAKSKPAQWWRLLFLEKPVKQPSKRIQNTSK